MFFDKYEITGFDNIKIVNFSDIHYSNSFNIKTFNLIIKKLIDIKPNYITIVGDIIDNVNVIDSNNYLFNFFKELAKISKVIICYGNHDLYKPVEKNNIIFDKISNINNVHILYNNSYIDNNISFSNINLKKEVYENNIDDVDTNDCNISFSKYNILLMHNPMIIKKNFNIFKQFDLILCGHMHNGMVPHFIKGKFGIINPKRELFVKYARGFLKIDNTNIITSGGITKLSKGSKFGMFNFLYKPQIDIIKIKKL